MSQNNTDELYHYGVLGMKWGVRKLDEKNGDLYLKKGTVVKRIATDHSDRVHDNKKYVSINQEDHDKWEDYLGNANLQRGRATYIHSYTAVKDLKVMDSTKQGKLFVEMMMKDKKFKNQVIKDLDSYHKIMPYVKRSDDNAENISRLMSIRQLETGRKFIDEIMSRGYDAVVDTHGTNTAKTPLIVLNADTNLKKLDNVEYSKAVQDYLKERYGVTA